MYLSKFKKVYGGFYKVMLWARNINVGGFKQDFVLSKQIIIAEIEKTEKVKITSSDNTT